MSVIFALLFSIVVVLARSGYGRRHTLKREQSSSGDVSTSLLHKSERAGSFLTVIVILSLLGVLGTASCHFMTTNVSSSSDQRIKGATGPLNDRTSQEPEADLADPSVAEDVAVMKTYQKALVDQLENTSRALTTQPGDATLLQRKRLLEVLLTNAGRTGVNDRLAAINAPVRMAGPQEARTNEGVAAARQAVADLRQSAASWKTGPFANAGRILGLHWQDGNGLTLSAPYVWGKNGWEADQMSQTGSQK